MPSKWSRQSKINMGKSSRQPLAGFGQISLHVNPGREKEGQQHHSLGPLLHAQRSPLFDRRRRQFKKRRDHNVIVAAPPKLLREIVQIGIGLRLAAAVRDQLQSSAHEVMSREDARKLRRSRKNENTKRKSV